MFVISLRMRKEALSIETVKQLLKEHHLWAAAITRYVAIKDKEMETLFLKSRGEWFFLVELSVGWSSGSLQ